MNTNFIKNMELTTVRQWRETMVDRNMIILISLPVTVVLHNVACFGFWYGMTIVSCYLAGIYCCRFVMREWSLSHIRMIFANADGSATTTTTSHARKKESIAYGQVYASLPIDRAIDQIFCRITDQYISTWYSHISSDDWFQFEIRCAIRRIVCSVYDRIARMNLERFILYKVAPVCLAHAIGAQKKTEISRLHVAVHSRKSEVMYVQNLSKCMLKFLLPEYDFNCKSYEILLRQIVSKSVILSLSDAICNPCVLNQLILRHLELGEKNFADGGIGCSSGGGQVTDQSSLPNKPTQLLLHRFVNVYETNASHSASLRPDMNDILKDKELQDTFMRYLKSRNAEHVLQFCLDIAGFNEKILKPELEAEELDDLYRDAWDLFSVYFSSYSPNCINFHKDLASPLRKALSKDILKLRTTATLFEAYEYAFSILENHCQDFHNSAEFYRWLYGRCNAHNSTAFENDSLPTRASLTAASSSSLSSSSFSSSSSSSFSSSTFTGGVSAAKESFGRKTISEIGQKFGKIKEALRSESVLDGRLYGDYIGDFSDRTSEAQEYDCSELGVDVQLALPPSPVVENKNINSWKISIPTVSWKTDPVTGSMHAILVLQVVHENKTRQLVERRPIDVHSLHSKLVEYYGKEFPDLELPILKVETPQHVSTLSKENVQLYEEYLNELIGCARLNDSELLYTFFTSIEYVSTTCEQLFTAKEYENDDSDDDDDDDDDGVDDDGIVVADDSDDDCEDEEPSLGKIFRKSVVPTLRKERGQNLETFIDSLMNSCTMKNNNEWKDVNAEKKSHKKTNLNVRSCQLYGNNFDVDASKTRETVLVAKSVNFSSRPRLTPFSLLIHAAYKIYNLRSELVRMLVCFKCAFGNVVDQLVVKITKSRLRGVAMERNVAYFINTIEWAVFDNKTRYSEHLVREAVTSLLTSMNDNWLYSAYQLIFQTLQDPKKNKQLFYHLCDVLIEELFPEIFIGDEGDGGGNNNVNGNARTPD